MRKNMKKTQKRSKTVTKNRKQRKSATNKRHTMKKRGGGCGCELTGGYRYDKRASMASKKRMATRASKKRRSKKSKK